MANSDPHRYWRLYSHSDGLRDYTILAEFNMFESVGGDEVSYVGGVASATSESSPASNAFDDSPSTNWETIQHSTSEDQWLTYDFGLGNEKAIREVSIQSSATPGDESLCLNAFDIEYSDDGVNWFSVGSFTTNSTWTLGEIRTWQASYSFDISIDHTKVPEDLYDFPLLVNLGATSGIDAFDSSGVFDELDRQNVDDDFTGVDGDPPDGELWISNDGSVEINSNRLHHYISNAPTSWYATTLDTPYNISGDFDIQIDVTDFVHYNNTKSYFVIEIRFDGTNRALVGFKYDSIVEYTSQINNGTLYSVDVTAVNSYGQLRITRVGTLVSTYYSVEINNSWVLIDSKTINSVDSERLRVYTQVSTINTSADAYLDNFKVNSGTIVWPEGSLPVTQINAITAVYKNPADNTYPTSVDDDFTGTDGDAPDNVLWINGVDRYDLSVTTDILVINSNTITPVLPNIETTFVSEWTVEGDFDVEIDTSMGTYSGTDALHFRMMFEKSSQFDRIEIYRDVSSTIVYSYASLDGSTVLNINNDVLVANSKLRITRVGNLLKTYYDIGGGWVEHGSATIPFAISGKAGVNIRNDVLNTHSMDNFKVNSGTIVWPQPADTSVISQQCKVEIDRWDQVNQQSQLPIIVPYISKDVDTIINLSYDSTNVDNSDNVGETGTLPAILVWSEYDTVYHLSKDGADSAGNSLDGILVNIDGTNIVDFGIGKGMTFNGVDERIDLTVNDLGRVYTISMIIELTDVTGVKTLVDGGNGGWYIDGDKISYNTTSDGTTALVATTLYEIVLQDNNGVGSTYINGVIADSITPDAVNMIIDTIAAETGTPINHLSCKLKEIRFSKDLKSAGWIATTYESMQDNLVRYEHADSFLLDKIISGTITETLAVTQWLIRSYDYVTGALVASMVSPNGAFELSIPVGYWTPQSVTISPDQGIIWSPETAKDIGDLVFPNDPVTTPYYFQCTVSGTVGDGVTGTTEPDFNSNTLPGNTVVDGNVTWEVVERMVQPITHSPLIPL